MRETPDKGLTGNSCAILGGHEPKMIQGSIHTMCYKHFANNNEKPQAFPRGLDVPGNRSPKLKGGSVPTT